MTKMSSNPCSDARTRTIAALVLLAAVAAAAAVPAAAISTSNENVPAEAEAGTQITASLTLTDLYQNPQMSEWTLVGQTELTQVTWTVAYLDATDTQINQESQDGQQFSSEQTVSQEATVNKVEVSVTGTVPEVANFSYDPEEEFLVFSLTQSRTGGTSNHVGEWSSHHYTADSKEAREAIDAARAAVDSAGGADVSDQRETIDSAISAYNNENFANAVELAQRAEENANEKAAGYRQGQLLLYGVLGILAVALLVGGVLWYQSQKESYDKLA